jgi:uncharacterized surface protein with fasciclin (FAS1) repeats
MEGACAAPLEGRSGMIMRRTSLLAFTCLLAACGGDGGNQAGGNAAAGGQAAGNGTAASRATIGDALAGSADHSAFLQALQASGLIETLRGAGPYTVFAPSNAAFDAIPEETRRSLMAPEQRDRLIALLSYHIVPGTVTSADLRNAIARGASGRAELATVTGANLSLFQEGEAIIVSDGANTRARITNADQNQANGVVHSVDTVLMPPDSR